METKQCSKCGARFLDGELYWRTGKKGKLEDLAGLVCDQWGDANCINEVRGTKHTGQTWEKRAAFIEGLDQGMKATSKLFGDDNGKLH